MIRTKDLRSGLVDETNRKEINALIERGTFKIVLRSEAGKDPNIIPSRFVLALKHKCGSPNVYEPLFVAGGHEYRDSGQDFYNATTLKYSSLRLIMSLASIFGFDMYAIDITQTFLRPVSKLCRRISINLINVLKYDELLQLMKPIYELTESGDHWNEKLKKH